MADEKHTYVPLQNSDDDSEGVTEYLKTIKLWRSRFFILLGWFAISLLVIAGLVVREVAWRRASPVSILTSDVKEPYSPAAGEVEWTSRWLSRDSETHRFMGKPRPELDEAWHELLNGTLIRMTEEELLQADNATSIRHKDGGYVAGLGISHSLHCLKRIKQYLHPDYYYSAPGQNWEELESHADHCLESLRQSLMCQPDLSVYTLEWTRHSRFKPAVRVPQPHTCMNFNRIHDWMEGRLATNDEMVPPDPAMYESHQVEATAK